MQTMSLGKGAFVWSKKSGANLTIEPANKAFEQWMINTESSVTPLPEDK